MKGTEWYTNYHNTNILTTNIMTPIYRFTDAIIGAAERREILGSRYRHTTVPDHFNYTVHNKLGESYSDERYMMITMFDTVIYDTVWSEINRFNAEDFQLLLNDSSVNKLYSNSETNIYYVVEVK
jgi:hypothetical protein